MQKLTALIIITAYIIYFLLLPLLTNHDEPQHVRIIIGLSQNKYLYVNRENNEKEINAIKKVLDSINFIESPYQLPSYHGLFSLREEKNDTNLDGIYSHQAYSPPFYYLLGTIYYKLAQMTSYLFIQFYILRLVSTVFYFATVFMVWKTLILFLKNKTSASSVLIFFALNPLVIKMGTGVNPDIAITFFSISILYLLLKSIKTSLAFKKILILATLCAIATLTKITGLCTNLIFTVYVIYSYGLNKKSITKVLLFQIIFLFITLPWFLFAYERYNTFFPQILTTFSPQTEHLTSFMKIVHTFTVFRFTVMNFSGFMGGGWPHPYRWFFVTYTILFVLFVLIGLINVIRQKEIKFKITLIYLLSFSLFFLMMSMGFRLNKLDLDVQGRFILPIFPVLCLYIYFGIFWFIKKEHNTALILRGFAIFQYLFILFTVIIQRYYV
jgi:4-amino-4-deoxy-L-arabinose transferase-like glycosyltransferase